VRFRHDACIIRPERSLTMTEIMAGSISGPDVGRFERLVQKNKMSAEQATAARQRLRKAAKATALVRTLSSQSSSKFNSPFGFLGTPGDRSFPIPMGSLAPALAPASLAPLNIA
jgi:hypothetical protein